MTSVIFRKLSAVELQLYSPSLCLPCVDTDQQRHRNPMSAKSAAAMIVC